MAVPPDQTCNGCQFLDFDGIARFYGKTEVVAGDGTRLGWCRANPPLPRPFATDAVYQAVRLNMTLGVEWPEVRVDDWCGSWKQNVPNVQQAGH